MGNFARFFWGILLDKTHLAEPVGKQKHVLPVDLVVQRVESVARRFLRFGIQRHLQLPNLLWSC
jgi:hypothetical protein